MANLAIREVGKISIDLGGHLPRHKGDDLYIKIQNGTDILIWLMSWFCFLRGVALSSDIHDPWLFPQGDSSLFSILMAISNRHYCHILWDCTDFIALFPDSLGTLEFLIAL